MSKYKLYMGDCLEELSFFPDNSVDSIVTDPPYGLAFMGKRWDYDVPSIETWAECLRVLKPGGHLLAFFGTRTYHRGVVPIEDAGFEIRDQIAWAYGSGFPKSPNIDGGFGTALKPALEPIVMARKPLDGTVTENMSAWQTGALNIDGCRVPIAEGDVNPSIARRQGAINHLSKRSAAEAEAEGKMESRQTEDAFRRERTGEELGRWPANLIHDGSDEVLAAFPQAQGQQGTTGKRKQGNVYGIVTNDGEGVKPRGDAGSAARFFYCAKASKSDRGADNKHPTVKPTDLMRYLCRLVTPAGGLVLDPFMGSGSTGKAAILEGFRFIGIEREVEYMKVARVRIGTAFAQQDDEL